MAVTTTAGGVEVTAAMATTLKAMLLARTVTVSPPTWNVLVIYWLSPASAGDTFTVTNGAGQTVLTGTCETALQSQRFFFDSLAVSDLQVTQISSGSLFINFGGGSQPWV